MEKVELSCLHPHHYLSPTTSDFYSILKTEVQKDRSSVWRTGGPSVYVWSLSVPYPLRFVVKAPLRRSKASELYEPMSGSTVILGQKMLLFAYGSKTD